MPRTIQCNQCGVILNLPENSGGKRLKCPKCGTKFVVGPDSSQYPTTERSDVDARAASSSLLQSGGHGDFSLPTSAGDLRETFDLPLMTEAASAPAGAAKPAATDTAADALMLFDERQTVPRRKLAAEARSKARRCPTCGGVVPVGMSICSSCGLDLESGARVQLDNDDLLPSAPLRSSGPPLPVTIIALVSLLGSLILALYSTVQWFKGVDGCQYFIPVCLFGCFAAVHLLRGRTAKLLMVALALGAMIDVAALIAMPVFEANQATRTVEVKHNADDPDAANVAIEPITDHLDSQKLGLGIAILLAYAAVSAYLASPSVRNHYARN
ncbi:zinc ribbon domain-containing protein [Singulisphaera acidiphila]|uniref:Zinc finger/thioredoxin putative domain-containing protein n=1 Tax=Singulisphaera acidiphila (strain ATCC BAA-1392 / DSM 18658 / VKM B-2454 / MOB10) TaxID=886293 RepID=L0DIY9_SINAD|nr:hypothetical protein [Singulisphaera acidiphila]AGA29227.1 hypothetical protein Sinac_5075 [Singulisphaera acidiphila DSM 18658]